MKKVMVVEDDPSIRDGIIDFLRLEGFEVNENENGMEALTSLKYFDPDIVISDVMMPVMDGHTLLSEYRKMNENKAVPFIFLTALSDRKDLRRGMKLGADDYLTKPFSNIELLDAIQTQYEKYFDRRHKVENELETMVHHRLSAAEKEKESIIMELHHRVKHNLAIISAFFDLGDPEKGDEYIESIRKRVFALASVHEEAYSNEMLTSVSVRNLVSNIITKLLADSNVLLTEDLEDYDLDIAKAIPFGLLFFELLSALVRNCPDEEKSAYIILRSFSANERGVLSLITNNLPPLNLDDHSNDGDMILLQAFVSQLEGKMDFEVVPDLGVRYTIDFSV